MLTQERLKDLLHYDPETGVFTRKVALSPKTRVGEVAGGKCSLGYWQISVEGKLHRSHRLAWLYIKGKWPKHQIDHIDGNKCNNSFRNLREANFNQNSFNRPKQSNNTSGYKGVSWHDKANKWTAEIKAYGVKRRLGLFKSKLAAYRAYCKAARALHKEFTNTGD